MRVLGVPGSLRRGSVNRGLLLAMADAAPDGVELRVFEGLKAVPPFDEDDEALPSAPGLRAWKDALRWAELVVFATPEYNTTLPGQLKNAVDWASRPFGPAAVLWGRPVAVAGASSTAYGAVWSQEHLRKALAKAGARVLGPELSVPRAATSFGPDGVCTSDVVRRRAGRFLLASLEECRALSAA